MKTLSAIAVAAAVLSPSWAHADPAGRYTCVAFIGGQLVKMLQPFTITGNRYVAEDGSSGSVTYDRATKAVTFQGGAFNDQPARYDGTKINFGRNNSVNCSPG